MEDVVTKLLGHRIGFELDILRQRFQVASKAIGSLKPTFRRGSH